MASTTYHFRAFATNTSGTGVGGDQTFTTGTGDTIAPIVSVTAPTASSTVSGIVTLTASSTDNVSVAGVTFYIDGAMVGSLATSTNTIFSTSWNSASSTNATHSIVAVSTDTSNNVATSSAVFFNVDNSMASTSAMNALTTTHFGADNAGPLFENVTGASAPVNNYLALPTGTTCVNGVNPNPLGMPCIGNTTITSTSSDFTIGIGFVTSKVDTQSSAYMEGIGSNISSGSILGTNCATSGNNHCLGLVTAASTTIGYQNPSLYFYGAAGGILYCSSNQFTTLFQGLQPSHRYVWMTGTVNGVPWMSLNDGVTGQPTAGSPQVCSGGTIWGSGKYAGTGVTSGGIAIANTDLFNYIGGAGNITAGFKDGWGGSIGPIFNLLGTFPNTAGTPSAAVLQNIASGATNVLTSPPSGTTVHAYYKMNDVGTWADSTGNYGNLTPTGTFDAGSPAIVPSQITIDERESGMVFSIDHSTITPNSSGAVCYSGSPATGTGYFTGTWAQNTLGQSPTFIIVSVLNSSGTTIAQTSVSPVGSTSGTWSANISGIPWGGPYTVQAQWSNSMTTMYHSENKFYVGISLIEDSQSEWVRGLSSAQTGDDVGSNGEIASVVQPAPMGTSGLTNSGDNPGEYGTITFLDSNNWPGQNVPKYAKYSFTVGTADQLSAYVKNVYGWSGCPVMTVPVGRAGHSRETVALDRQVFPNANALTNGLTSVQNWVATSANTFAADLKVTAYDNTQRPYVLPGSISIAIPYSGGTVTATDNGAGVLSAPDGSSGITNYGFNSVTTDTPALFTDLHLTTANSLYYDAIGCEINSISTNGLCQTTTPGLIQGTANGLTTATTLAGSGTAHFCLDQPNVAAAVSSFCPSGYKITMTLGTNTVGDLINAINASPYAPLVQASLVSGVFTLTPVGPYTVSLTVAGTPPTASAFTTAQAATWTTDLETINGAGTPRGSYLGAGTTPTEIPDGWGVVGDLKNCSSGYESMLLCQVRAPFTAGLQVIGAADENQSSTTMEQIDQAVFAKYATQPNANASMPWDIMLAHRTGGQPTTGTFIQGTNYRSMTQAVASQGTVNGVPYYNAGNCGLYQIYLNSGPHPDTSVGGALLFGDCAGEGMRDAVLGTGGSSWTGPVISSVAFDTTYTGCSTPGTCIKVGFTLAPHATALTTAGGLTAASSTGPTGCTAGTTYIDGEVKFICLSAGSPDAFQARANSTAYQIGDLVSAVPASDPYSYGNIYQAFTAGTSGSTNPFTLSNEFNFNTGVTDGTVTMNYLGYNTPYANNLPLYPGMLVTNGGNVYEVTGSAPTMPLPQGNCNGFDVGPNGAELENTGFNPRTLATSGTTFTCKIIDATHVELINNTGTWPSGTTGILYSAGNISDTVSGWNTPTDQESLAGYITDNRGFVPIVTSGGSTFNVFPGMPALPVLNSLSAGTHS
jgi:hypothetical protein